MTTTTSVSEESIDQCWKLLLQPFVIWRRSGPESFYTRFCWLAFSVSERPEFINSSLLCASNLNFVDGASLQGIHTPASSSDFLCCCCQNISGLKRSSNNRDGKSCEAKSWPLKLFLTGLNANKMHFHQHFKRVLWDSEMTMQGRNH